MRIESMRLLNKSHKRNTKWKTELTAEIKRELEWELNLRLEFYDDGEYIWTDHIVEEKAELERCIDHVSEISTLICAAVQLSTDMDKVAAKRYIDTLSETSSEVIHLADFCMEIYGVLSVCKCEEYAKRILNGESMFATA